MAEGLSRLSVDASFPAFFDVLYDLGATVRR
jgi:hypothetical protein